MNDQRSPRATHDRGEDAAWRSHCLPLERSQARLIAVLATLLVPAWIPFDFLLEPGLAPQFLVYRLVDVAVGVAVLLRLRTAATLTEVRALAMGKLVVTGGVIALMVPQIGATYWLYLLGFSLVFWGAAVALSMPVVVVAAGLGSVIVTAGAAIALHPDRRSFEEVVGGAFYIVSAYVVCLAQVFLRRRLERRAFRATHELAAATRKVLAHEDAKTRFFANVSHELRTPLALILGPAERLAAAPDLSPDRRAELDVVVRNARTLLQQVNNLLDVARLEAKEAALTPARTDVARVVRVAAAHFEALAVERDVALTVDAPTELHAVVDRDKLARVLLNLLSNAFKLTPSGGRVRCALRAAGDGFAIEVADSGPGVPEAQRDVVFDRFRQLDGGTTRRFGGSGLGLAIVKDFVELHGGRVHVADAPEGGALFVVELPVRAAGDATAAAEGAHDVVVDEEAAAQVLAELRAPATPPPDDEKGDGPLVLVVEDNPEMNRFVRERLAPEHRTAAASDGRAGLDKARALQPDLVVTDVMMPGMGGDELVRALRADPATADVPVLVLTAKADDPLRVRMLEDGAQDYVMKPFSAAELRARVRNLVAAKRARDVLRAELDVKGDSLESMAKQLARRGRDLQTALAEAMVARDHAEQATRIKTRFLELVSHELRTPLTTLQLQLDRMERGRGEPLTPSVQARVARMSRSAQRLLRMVESLLEQARIQSGRLDVDVAAFDLAAAAREAVDEVAPLAEEKGLRVELVDDAVALPPLASDERLVRLVVLNLLGNAVKFTQRGHVRVHLRVEDGAHVVVVEDTGPGIAQHELQRIFEPFERSDAARDAQVPGVGLGLALVQEMIGALGGRIDVESVVGEGSRFSVRLPSLAASATASLPR